MIIKDLDLCTYDNWYQKMFPGCVAVGWIHSDKDYKPHGVLMEEFIPALKALIKNKHFIPGPYYMGIHDCEFCRKATKENKPIPLTRKEWEEKYNKGKDWPPPKRKAEPNYRDERHDNLIIEGEDKIYAAPELLLHYVEKHEYIPPMEFQITVINKEATNA